MANEHPSSIAFGVSVVQDIIAAGYDILNKEAPQRDMIREATERYVSGLFERFGTMKVLGMSRPVPLLSLYIRANVLEKISSWAGANVEELEASFDFDRRAFGKKIETKDAEAIANQLPKFIVLGKPGSGKTTFLKFLTLSILSEDTRIKTRRLPVFITLRDWADAGVGLMQYIAGQFDIYGFAHTGPFIERVLRQGNCLVLFDGLDEVSQETNLDGIIRDIRDFTDKYSGNHFVISCRVAAYNQWFERYTDVEMTDFNEEQIKIFVRNWFSSESDVAEACIKQLQASPQLREISSIPLLLTLLCITYNDNNSFPANRADLYEVAIEALLRKWDSTRRIRRDDPYKQLSLKQKENMFARIAYGTFSEGRYFIREHELAKMIGNFIGNLPAFKEERVEIDGGEVLRTIEAHHGIFVERAKNIHSFAHLTFQEYFTAKYIVNDALNGALEKLAQEHLYDDKWKEVFLLAVGMLHDADELLLLMLKKNRELLIEPILNRLIDKAPTALLKTSPKYSAETRKSVFVFIVLTRALAGERARAQALSLASDRARTLAIHLAGAHASDLEIALDLDLDLELAFAFDRTLALDLDLDLEFARAQAHTLKATQENNKDVEIVENISAFLAVNLLIVRCLAVATYLSNSTREYVLKMILAPREEGE